MQIRKLESIWIIYKELFTIKFLHNNYGFPHQNSLAEDIRIQPDELTKKLFANYIIGYRFLDDSLVCYMRSKLRNPPAKEPKVPFLKISGDQQIRFLIHVSSRFFKKTFIDAVGAKEVYQFSNRNNIGTNNFISRHEEGINSDDLSDAGTVKADTNCLAVIDIFNSGAINNSYDLFIGEEQQLKSPVYRLRFKN